MSGVYRRDPVVDGSDQACTSTTSTIHLLHNKQGILPLSPRPPTYFIFLFLVAPFCHPSPQSRRKNMSQPSISNYTQQQFSLCPTFVHLCPSCLVPHIASFSNGRQAVGDGAFTSDNTPSVLAVCHMQGTDDMYYYSTTFSGGPGVCLARH